MENSVVKSDTASRLLKEARWFFKRIRLIHGICAVFIIVTGAVSVYYSDGSDGSSKIPYYFSAFIAGPWHLMLIVFCQICLHFLSGDPKKIPNAALSVSVYSICNTVFVLFNVMGFVFVIVNGLCIREQQCYYDKNDAENRALAIILILEHIASILVCVIFSKRAHSIDAELGSDISIRLGHYLEALRERVRTRHRSTTSSAFHASSISTLGSCTSLARTNAKSQDHQSADKKSDKNKHAALVKEIREREEKNRSKSHPNLHRHNNESHNNFPDIEGTLVSIYSDSETTPSIDGRKRKRFTRQKNNVIKPVNDSSESSPEKIPDVETEVEAGNQKMEYTDRSLDSGVSVDDDKWSSSSTSTFRQRLDLVNKKCNAMSAQTSDIASASDITETDSDIVTYRNKLDQQLHREELRHQMLDKQQHLLENRSNSEISSPPSYEESFPIPNATVVSVEPAKEMDEKVPVFLENENQSNC